MKDLLPFLIVFFLTAPKTVGADTTVSGFVAVKSAYVLDNGFAPNDEEVAQADIVISHASGFHTELWASAGLTQSTQNEVDIVIGYSGKVGNVGYKVDLPYYEIRGGIDMTAPLIELYPAERWTLGTQYFFGTTGAQGKKFWVGYGDGPWSLQLSRTDFFGRVTALKGSWSHPLTEGLVASITAIVPIADPDDTGHDARLIATLQWNF